MKRKIKKGLYYISFTEAGQFGAVQVAVNQRLYFDDFMKLVLAQIHQEYRTSVPVVIALSKVA